MFKKAMEELDRLSKSGKPEDELEELAKALEAELGLGEDMSKSHQEPAAAAATEEGKEPAAAATEVAPLAKSQQELEEDELVLASEAYGALQKSVHEGTEATLGEMEIIKKSLGALLNLSIKLAGVVGQIASDKTDGMERIAKSMETLAGTPLVPNRAMIGAGAAEINEGEGELKKSNSEIQDLLMKAINEGSVAAHHLSTFGTYKDVNRLPVGVQKILGL